MGWGREGKGREKYSVGVRNQCQEPVGGDAVEGVVGRHCEIWLFGWLDVSKRLWVFGEGVKLRAWWIERGLVYMYGVSQPAYVYLLVGVNRDLCSVCAHVALVGWRLPQASHFFRPRSLPRLGCVARGHGGIGVWRIVLMVLTFGWDV
jgi:hypothetical protein